MARRHLVSANFVCGFHTFAKGQMVWCLWLLCALAFALHSPTAHAELPEPKGQILLTIAGQIETTNKQGRAEFDRDMLENIGMVEFSTETPWTEGKTHFAGVPFSRLLDVISPKGSVARAVAANDYKADIPLAMLRENGALLAMRINGENMTLRNKGPLWIVFPWCQKSDLKHVEIYNYSVWQLLSLNIQ